MPAKPTTVEDGGFGNNLADFCTLAPVRRRPLGQAGRRPARVWLMVPRKADESGRPHQKGRNEVKTFGGTLVGLVPPLYAF